MKESSPSGPHGGRPQRSVAPEVARIPGPLTPAPGQVGTLNEQWLKTYLPRVPEGRGERLTRSEVEAFVLAAVASVLAAGQEPPTVVPPAIHRGRRDRGAA